MIITDAQRRLGRMLRIERQRQGLTLQLLSDLSGLSLPTISTIERGERNARLATLLSLVEALGFELDFTPTDDYP